MNYGYVKVAAVVPKMKVADTDFNTKEILRVINDIKDKGVNIISFPELCITGYTCGDLFFQNELLENVLEKLQVISENTKDIDSLIIVGAPLKNESMLFNCAVVFYRGSIKAVVPKSYLPNYNEFYEKRWFSSMLDNKKELSSIKLFGQDIPFNKVLIKSNKYKYTMGVEICEDMWSTIPPSSNMVLNGANIIVNISASDDLVGKNDYRKILIKSQSSRGICGYIYNSAGVNESTTDMVFGGYSCIYENGKLLEQNKRFDLETNIIISDIDLQFIENERIKNKTYADGSKNNMNDYIKVVLDDKDEKEYKFVLNRKIDSTPFIPSSEEIVVKRCEEIFMIQAMGLVKRLKHINIDKVVIGLSGGSDSTLALLVCNKAFEILNIDKKNIICVTMPGFGTSKRTLENACKLSDELNTSLRKIDITKCCEQHLKDINHDINNKDVTFENVQARERTQVLMDIGNKDNALVIGTGDLSELALGWCTYNGDHMSMYAVNSSIPKTLVKYLIRWYALNIGCKEVLFDVLDTPISPELLPLKDGIINQKTEDVLGPYEVHDFYIYNMLRHGVKPSKLLFMASRAFEDKYKEEDLKKWLKLFIKRFFSQQFKRSCMPDGPKVGTVNLSPRGDLKMPSDASVSDWLKDIN